MYYEVTPVSGGGFVTHNENDPELKRALETKKMTVWVGGSFGIVDDWGKAVTRDVKSIVRFNSDGSKDVLYEKPEKKQGFYYIENQIDERRSNETGYFKTLKEAKEALKSCADWFLGEGTGCIFFQPYGLKASREFVCRGKGLDKHGDVIFTTERF